MEKPEQDDLINARKRARHKELETVFNDRQMAADGLGQASHGLARMAGGLAGLAALVIDLDTENSKFRAVIENLENKVNRLEGMVLDLVHRRDNAT